MGSTSTSTSNSTLTTSATSTNVSSILSNLKINFQNSAFAYSGSGGAENAVKDSFGAAVGSMYQAISVASAEAKVIPYIGAVVGASIDLAQGVGNLVKGQYNAAIISGCSIAGGYVGGALGAATGDVLGGVANPIAVGFSIAGAGAGGTVGSWAGQAVCQTAVDVLANQSSANVSFIKSAVSAPPVVSFPTQASTQTDTGSLAASIVMFRPSSDYQGDNGAYTVQNGQTLSGIAKANGISLLDLTTANPQIKYPDSIRTGQIIQLPPNASGYIPGSSGENSIPNDAAQTGSLSTVLQLSAGDNVSIVAENSGRIAVLSTATGQVTIIANDGAISTENLASYNLQAQTTYNNYVSNGYVNSNTHVSYTDYQNNIYGSLNANGQGSVVCNAGMMYQDAIGNIVAQSTTGDLYASDSATQKSLFATDNGSGALANLVTNIQAYDAVTGDIAANIKTFDISGALASEQLATYSASRNLTQVINLANSSVIGCAVIDGQATLSQLAQESDLAVQMGVASSLTSSGVVDLFTSMGLSSSTSVIQALQTADQSYTGSNIAAAPVINSAADLNSYVTGKATDGSSTFVESVARIWATATDIVADPRALALEDGPLAIRLAQQNPSTLNVLVALQKIAIAGAVMSPEYFKATANQLGTTPDDLCNLVSRGGTALTSIIAAYQNPTPTSVAQAAIQLLQANVTFTEDMKRATAGALGLNTVDLTEMNNLLSYGGAGLAVVSALKNPTPQNIVQSSQQVLNALDTISGTTQYAQLTKQLQGINVALMVVELILPGPTQDVINGVYDAVLKLRVADSANDAVWKMTA